MCGIAGIFFFYETDKSYESGVRDAVSVLNHRGPDASGVRTYKNAILGHSRLSIIDLSSGANQPMQDGELTVVFNGEIYNYLHLKRELTNKGYKFHTDSDTEVLLKLYREYGKGMLDKLNGDFAFAIYDEKKLSVFIARDRFGIKPLYFVTGDDYIAFASELSALKKIVKDKQEIDLFSLKTLLQYTYIPSPYTILKRFRKLQAGAYLFVNDIKTEINTYYDKEKIFNVKEAAGEGNLEDELVKLLDDAVKKRLIADVEVGSFLSGGVDSSIVSALAAKHKKDLFTFNLGFPEHPYYDETKYALEVSRHIGSDHTVFEYKDDETIELIIEFLDKTSEPFADSSALAYYFLSKKTSEKLKVVLSGDGADEVFGGYNKHRAFLLAEKFWIRALSPLLKLLPGDGGRDGKLQDTWRKLKKLTQAAGLNRYERYKFLTCFSCNIVSDNLFNRDINKKVYDLRLREMFIPMEILPDARGVLWNDMELVLQNDMLYKADYYSMANSLEVRVPFLDHRVVEFASSIPANNKFTATESKVILKNAFRNFLPSTVFQRGKHGFEIPVIFSLSENFSLFSQLFSKDFIDSQGIFNFEEVEKIRKMIFSQNPTYYQPLVWAYVVFQWWYRKNFN